VPFKRNFAEPNGLKRLEEALTSASKRSPFSSYLRREFDAFSRVIGRVGPRWDVIAEWAKQEGHTEDGKPIKPATAKRAYEREKKRREKLAEKDAAKHPVTPVIPAARERPSVRMTPTAPAAADEPALATSPEVEKRLAEVRKSMIPDWEKKKDDRR
jgi:hypothetical protein